ncbi:MAG: hypothetical protein KKF42_08855, partial [Actinobacteria bacterium]|nr:hypothetical protein [Actinomycetota bacterium]
MANFTYDANTESFIMHSWLERGGTITEGATNCTIKIYDSVGASLTNIVKDTAQNGVFWQTW